MGLDEALLEAAGTGDPASLLRMYGWSIPTLSLGYFQRLAEVRADLRWCDVPIVRRPTGGGAIWHHHELTYALAVPETQPLSRPSTRLIRAVHAAISGGLEGFGVRAVRQGEVIPAPDCERSRPFLCFTDRSPDDIVFEGVKIVGSAQRRRGGAVLQHGSILLAQSSRTPELRGLRDVAQLSADPRGWSDRVAAWIASGIGARVLPASLPDFIRQRAVANDTRRYRDPGWTGIR
jgi:lipoyl(octanoyl) transferase